MLIQDYLFGHSTNFVDGTSMLFRISKVVGILQEQSFVRARKFIRYVLEPDDFVELFALKTSGDSRMLVIIKIFEQ